jgi:hypothetical protein
MRWEQSNRQLLNSGVSAVKVLLDLQTSGFKTEGVATGDVFHMKHFDF